MIQIEEKKYQDFVVLILQGKLLGGPEAQELLEKLQNMLDKGENKVIINLEGIERMNSSGLGIMISAFTSFKNNGGEIFFVKPNPMVQNLLKITKLDQVFRIFNSEDEVFKNS
jgi:anti-sigma B factor antagonist